MKLLLVATLSISVIAPAVAHNEARNFKAYPVAGGFSQNPPASRGLAAGNSDTSIPDVIASPKDSARPGAAVADER